ncbi:MAG: class I SAM-dependent methyltransferase [Ruminococcus sp.]|nr:class I SAM-dependent methyltransferase [Ruminococcus sp.]
MSGYGAFAEYYDKLQSSVPYKEMAERLDRLIKKYSSYSEVAVDLACGAGRLAEELLRLGYDVIGVDGSELMLSEAMSRETGEGITYLCQDMTELELWGAADAVVCTLDSLNHLPDIKSVSRTFEQVSKYLCSGGVFIFDVNTEHKHRSVLGDNCFVIEQEKLFCAWQNECSEDGSVFIKLDIFDGREGLYRRCTEEFKEILITPEQINEAAQDNGFTVTAVFDGYTENEPQKNSERLLYVLVRK